VSSKNVPLDPQVVAEIDDLLADETDPDIQVSLRGKMLAQAQAEANEQAADRTLYRSAVQSARDAGDPHPEIKAKFAVKRQKVIDQYEKRLRAIRRRVDALHRKRASGLARRVNKASKTAKPSQRRFAQLDADYVDIVGQAEKDGWLTHVPLVLLEIEKKIGRYRLPHWEKTTTSLKVMAMSIISNRDGAQTINLRVTHDLCDKALASDRGPASVMQDRIRNALGKTFGKGAVPDFWFVVEMNGTRGFHLHGAVITPAVVNGVELVNAALRDAGGEWAGPARRLYQQKALELNEPIYWASYACKSLAAGGLRTDRKLFASTIGVRTRAVAGWNGMRAALPQSP
jgi:hypothetical protein